MPRITLSKANFFHNLSIIEKKVGSKDKIAIVLKDNAYGHGIKEITKLSKEFGITNAIVKNNFEASIIKNSFKNILVLNDNLYDTFSHSFHITINSLSDIAKVPQNAIVHIKIDTGMHRNGISPSELEASILGLLEKKAHIYGLFTHHRSADELSSEFFWQNDQFMGIKAKTKQICEKLNISPPSFHSCNTAGLFRTNTLTSSFDDIYARIGIGAYGYIGGNNLLYNTDIEIDFKPVLSLYASKVSSRKISANQKIGYGGKYISNTSQIVSTYDIGYGDGFMRISDDKYFSTPQGYNILGRVSMDSISLDTDDDEVLIFDDIKSLAKLHDTIPYEILTSLKSNIPRQII
jgi:alanine racemase